MNINNNNTQVLSKEVSRELMNQVNEVVRASFNGRVRRTNSDVYYHIDYGTKLQCEISIELEYSDTKLEDNKLVLRWFDKRQNSMKFNYSESSIQRLLEQLEYLNVQLRINK